ncbi:hypothetical protein [Singulisphaera sp. PoT]|uniref:hypothetical protein n=1 Tax=Singulisphaera sp. PoT TaxID=3411797 RepID=UPI003BF4F665
MTEVCDIFRAYLAGPKGQPVDIKALQAVLEPIPRDERHNTEFLVGKILMDHGHPAEGLECIRRCSQSPGTYPPLKMVAENIVLRKDASKP